MKELIKRLTKNAGLSDEQAKQSISIVSDFITEKFPMLKGEIKNLLGDHETDDDTPQVGGINLSGLG
jgi:hypothetical protein